MTPDKPMRSLQEHELRLAIVDFAAGDSAEMVDEISSMTEEEVKSGLVEEGINIEPRLEEFRSRIVAARGKLRLEIARQQLNERKQNTSGRSPNWAQAAYDSLPTDPVVLRREIERLSAGGTGQAAFFRGYEDATTEDLQQILNDLRELKERSEEEAE